jgi:hypothetical protein
MAYRTESIGRTFTATNTWFLLFWHVNGSYWFCAVAILGGIRSIGSTTNVRDAVGDNYSTRINSEVIDQSLIFNTDQDSHVKYIASF